MFYSGPCDCGAGDCGRCRANPGYRCEECRSLAGRLTDDGICTSCDEYRRTHCAECTLELCDEEADAADDPRAPLCACCLLSRDTEGQAWLSARAAAAIAYQIEADAGFDHWPSPSDLPAELFVDGEVHPEFDAARARLRADEQDERPTVPARRVAGQ